MFVWFYIIDINLIRYNEVHLFMIHKQLSKTEYLLNINMLAQQILYTFAKIQSIKAFHSVHRVLSDTMPREFLSKRLLAFNLKISIAICRQTAKQRELQDQIHLSLLFSFLFYHIKHPYLYMNVKGESCRFIESFFAFLFLCATWLRQPFYMKNRS